LPICQRILRLLSTTLLLTLTQQGAIADEAAPLSAKLIYPPRASAAGFKMGTSRSPDGTTIEVDSRSLLLDGERWTPVMGEFHFSRYPESEWREELKKMKAGGVDVVATYVFWNHHEEEEGVWDWSGDRNLRAFVESAKDAGLKVIVRCGPWCHGEVRNGGTPDWVQKAGWKIRSNDPNYIARCEILYQQIAAQITGLLWKDGGPIIGIQLENEFKGEATHMLRLKEIARKSGLDVPLYTRTGWTDTRSPLAFGEVLPLYGAYAEGFWERSLEPMPAHYWAGFHFDSVRRDDNIEQAALRNHTAINSASAGTYPVLTCEIGGGMMSAYHRRIRIAPRDVESTTLVKIGSGSNSPGYYMYHGGINPEGKLTTLQETQDGMWNDMPVKNYDFQAPLGQYGQIRPHYHLLRRLHLFLQDFGPQLAEMDTVFPDVRPTGKEDDTTLRWAVRSNGQRGFVFVNNYERLKTLPPKQAVKFELRLADWMTLRFPELPFVVPSDACFVLPFDLALAPGVTLDWAMAQPICRQQDADGCTYFFAEIPGIEPSFKLQNPGFTVIDKGEIRPNHAPFWDVRSRDPNVKVRLVLLSESDSLKLEKDDQGQVVFRSEPAEVVAPLTFEQTKQAGPPRRIPLGHASEPVAAAPTDADFEQAAVWKIELPKTFDFKHRPLLRLHYVGDVARVFIGDRLIVDDFFNGDVFEVGLARYADELADNELTVQILPLSKDAPIGFSPPEARPDFGDRDSVVELNRAELVTEQPAQQD
jgi:beta-galactosidase